jgi:hypothetical protein
MDLRAQQDLLDGQFYDESVELALTRQRQDDLFSDPLWISLMIDQ